MDLKFQEKPLRFLSAARTDAVCQEETAELTLPDSLPDVDRIVQTHGVLLIRSVEQSTGACVVSGGIQATVLYCAEDDSVVKHVETYLTFRVRRELPDLAQEAQPVCSLRNLDARIINARKLLIRAGIGTEFTVLTQQEVSLAYPTDPPSCFQSRKDEYRLLLPQCCGETVFQISDEIDLPEDAPAIRKIVTSNAVPVVTEKKMIGSKAVFKGDLNLQLLYLDAADALHTWQGSVPFSQYAELEQDLDDAELVLKNTLTALEIETDGQADSRCLAINCGMKTAVIALARQTVELISDAYTTKGTLVPTWSELPVKALLDLPTKNEHAEIRFPVAASEVIDWQVYPGTVGYRREGERLWLSAPLTAHILYCDQEGRLQSGTAKGESTCEILLAQDAAAQGQITATGARCIIKEGEVVLQCETAFRIETYAGTTFRTLTAARIDENDAEQDRPSLIIRRAAEQSVWDLAKQNRSTVELICAANHLSGEPVSAGALLLIPLR